MLQSHQELQMNRERTVSEKHKRMWFPDRFIPKSKRSSYLWGGLKIQTTGRFILKVTSFTRYRFFEILGNHNSRLNLRYLGSKISRSITARLSLYRDQDSLLTSWTLRRSLPVRRDWTQSGPRPRSSDESTTQGKTSPLIFLRPG